MTTDPPPNATPDAPPAPGRPARVLVVDDNEANRFAVGFWLRDAGYGVLQAATGVEALARMGERPDLVVLDINLPDVSGFEVLRRIRADAATAATPVLHLSASFVTAEWRARGMEQGADAYLTHPIEPQELVATVRALLRVRAAEGERERLLTAERLARHEAEQARREAERSASAKSDFLAAMSHEIRTPINAQIGYTELLELGLAGPITPQQRDYLARLAASSRHLLGLVNDVLDFAKIDAGAFTVAHDRLHTGPAVSAALDLVRPQAAARGVTLIEDGRVDGAGDEDGDGGEEPAGPHTTYVGDEHRVRQVLVNLLSNAVKFTPPGGRVSISVRTVDEAGPGEAELYHDGPWVQLVVSDTGPGIMPERQIRLFEPFYQAEEPGGSVYTRRNAGTGLGLAISRRLARLMDGDLTLHSVPGEGAAFTVWLPAARGDESDDQSSDRASAGEAAEGGAPDPVAAALAAAPTGRRGYTRLARQLRRQLDAVLARLLARLRDDPLFLGVRGLNDTALEDHHLALLADICQTLAALDVDDATTASESARDGTSIQRVIAELHGRVRFDQGWTVDQLDREHAILAEEMAAAVRDGRTPSAGSGGATDPAAAQQVVQAGGELVTQLLARAAETSRRAWYHAGVAAGGTANGA